MFPQHENHTNSNIRGAVVVVIAWQLDLQQYVQSVPITTKAVSLNPVYVEVYSVQHYVIIYNYSLLLTSIRVFMDLKNNIHRSLNCFITLKWKMKVKVNTTKKNPDCYDITEILLKVVLNAINQTKPYIRRTNTRPINI